MNQDDNAKPYLTCHAYCTANGYDLPALASFLRQKGHFTRLAKYYLHASIDNHGDVFFFNYGCFVSWGLSKRQENRVIKYVANYSSDPLKVIEEDTFCYQLGDTTSMDTDEGLDVDLIMLASDDISLKLAFSFGLSQSIKLESFEESVQEVIKKNQKLPNEIVKMGGISLSRRAIFKRMGEIFIARSSINLNIEYLDTPEFFWRNPSLEEYYILVKNFMDLHARVMSLNQRLDVLQELLDMLNTQVQHRHSSLLESVIIVLIAVEIIISLFQFHIV